MAGLYTGREAACDAARITKLARLLGVERLGQLIDILEARLDRVRTRLKDDFEVSDLIDAVHQSRGSASSLGFSRVAGSLRRLEILMGEAVNEVSRGTKLPGDWRPQISEMLSNVLSELNEARSDTMRVLERSPLGERPRSNVASR